MLDHDALGDGTRIWFRIAMPRFATKAEALTEWRATAKTCAAPDWQSKGHPGCSWLSTTATEGWHVHSCADDEGY